MGATPDRVDAFLTQITSECIKKNLNDYISRIFESNNSDSIHPCLHDVLQVAMASTFNAPRTVKDRIEQFDLQFQQLLAAVQEKLIVSPPLCKQEDTTTAWTGFDCTFDDFQSSSLVEIRFYETNLREEEFERACDKFVAQLAIARAAIDKLLVREKLNLFLTAMLAREGHMQLTRENAADDAMYTEFAGAVASLPSCPLNMIGEAMISNGEEVEP
jgi:hypothetical protein